MDYTEFMEDIDGAKYIYTDSDNELVLVWHGGDTVNIYQYTPDDITEIDMFTDYTLTKDNIRAEMESHIEYMLEGDNSE